MSVMERNGISITETGDYGELIPLFRDSGLEIHIEDGRPKDMLTCWRADDREGRLIGGVSVERRSEYFVIGDIAVNESSRGERVGSVLLETALARIEELGGSSVYLVAKAPKFFAKFGFVYLSEREAPDVFSCKTCGQRGTDCFPEFMMRKYKD